MGIRQNRGQVSIDFLREWVIFLARPQARFDMSDSDLMVKSGQRTDKSSGGVALNHDKVGLLLLKNGVKAGHGVHGNLSTTLTWLYDVEVIIGFDGKEFEHLVQHLAMLGSDNRDGIKPLRVLFETINQRS